MSSTGSAAGAASAAGGAAAVKRHGRHYTPRELAGFLADRVARLLPDRPDIGVLDPACGDGELLLAVHRAVLRRAPRARLTLVGHDLDPEALRAARARAAALGLDVRWHEGDFLRVARELPPASFDAVVTNPPYVRTQALGRETARTLAAEFGLTGRIDLTHPFVAVVPSLLRPGGVLGLLCSNRFLTTRAGANVRRVLSGPLRPVELYDLGDTRLFGASVLPAVVIARRSPEPPPTCSFTSAYADGTPATTPVDLYEALAAGRDGTVAHRGRTIRVTAGTLSPSAPDSPWRPSRPAAEPWLGAVRGATWRTFGDVARIRVGIKTTADDVFLSTDWSRTHPCPEPELLRPLITHRDVAAWRVGTPLPTRVLYPYDLGRPTRTVVDLARYPRAEAYLEAHGERLRSRRYVTRGGRRWFEIWVPQRPALWAFPKIVFPDISATARFAYDTSGAIVNGDCYWISLTDVGDEDLAFLLLAVANSALGRRFYDEVCGNRLYTGRRRWMTQYVARLPLPDPRTEAARRLVGAAKELLAPDGAAGAPPDAVDALVERAFGLTGA